MRNGHGTLTRRTAIASAAAAAAIVAGGGYALASTNGNAPAASSNGVSLTYLMGSSVNVAPHAIGEIATACPAGLYPIAGGPTSSQATWEIQWSTADRSTTKAKMPDEWSVSLLNNSAKRASFKVFVTCASASSVTGNT